MHTYFFLRKSSFIRTVLPSENCVHERKCWDDVLFINCQVNFVVKFNTCAYDIPAFYFRQCQFKKNRQIFFLNIHNAQVGPCLIKRRSILLKNNGKFTIVYVSILRKRSTAYIICQLLSPNLCYWVDDYWLETDLRHRIPARYQPFSDNTHVCKVYSDWLIKSWVQHSKSCARDK